SGEPAKGRPEEVGVYVPAGQSRVVRLARPSGRSADRIVLRGDDHDFDNTFYVVPPLMQPASVLYVGTDSADDAAGLLHYLKLALANDPVRTVEIRSPAADAPPVLSEPAPSLTVVSQRLSAALEAALRPRVEQGGMLLLVPANPESAGSLSIFFDDVEIKAAEKVRDDHFLLLGDINFSHPLFAPFANPRYSDFTKIHFWKHRPLSLKTRATTTVVARFDNGDPAVLERTLGRGRILA